MHLPGPDCDKHQRALERETLLDRAALTYAEALNGQAAAIPEVSTMTRPVSADSPTNLPMSRALKFQCFTESTIYTKSEI